MNIGNNITALRNHFGLSQKEFAKKIGISKATVSLWENEKKYPSKKNIDKLISIFNLKPGDFFGTDISEILITQHQLPFQPSVYHIKPGIELNVRTEKLSREELASLEKVIKILKVFYS